MIKVFNRFREYLTDHSVKLKDRTFMLFSAVTVVALLVTVICGLFTAPRVGMLVTRLSVS